MKKKLILALLAAGLTQGAAAGFIDQSETNPFAENPQMRLIGSARFEDLPGFARSVSLHEALSQIIPRSYTVRTMGIEPVAADLVNWQGGKPWTKVLHDVLRQVPRLQAEIDANSKIVTLSLADTAVAYPVAPATKEGEKAAPAQVWKVQRTDTTVRRTFERWGKTSGWQVVWELDVDFPIDAEATLTNIEFEEAIQMVTKSLQRVDVAPKAIFYRGNSVLRIVARGTE